MELTKLKNHLWEAANILRGSAVDRTDWKGYILPLLFFKRISDVWDEEHARMLEEFDKKYQQTLEPLRDEMRQERIQ